MSNFEFLRSEWPSLYEKMRKAEERVHTEPSFTGSYCRLVLEECVHILYREHQWDYPYNKNLENLMREEEFKYTIGHYYNSLHIIRKTGNNAVHYGRRVSGRDALVSIRYLYAFLKWFARDYSDAELALPGPFDESKIPKVGAKARQLKLLKAEHEKAQKALAAENERLQQAAQAALERAQQNELALATYKEKKEEEVAALLAQKEERRSTPIGTEFTEAETRTHLIDVDLKSAGWQLSSREREVRVSGMPITPDNPKGNGYVDYVLWDDNGKPLAVVEAKRTSKDVEAGKHQAFLYANCLEKQYGQRPVIFYSNGYETRLWDDCFYSAPRRVYGFYTKAELQWLIQRRSGLKDIRKAKVDAEIAGRPYQLEAIQRVAESFVVDGEKGLRGGKRNVLLVMATGSGKTRTAAALVDVLFKYGWVKRVLFLADRKALVRQAKRSFGEHLPDLSAINLVEEKEDNSTRLVFSTYPTMMGRIDGEGKDERFYGVGHFDLIIIDEAHRSVYNRYQAIFEYFDALLVGLTATPKDSIDHNTFELFGCSEGDPTFSFELQEAVPTYLKGYRNLDVATDFMREGIRYHQLSEEQRAQFEETFMDNSTGIFPEEIDANAMNKWLFNKDTVNKVLDALMSQGLRIEGGDKLGRTIIFAVNQNHAKFIVECFVKRYPELPSGFVSMVHHGVSHAQSLIDDFCDKDKELLPQVVVSVDMMDTGIDAPRVLNLVFFKVVRSYAKFWQMIGRGTRLCPDVFGPGQPKEHFLILDVCQNFEFFRVTVKGHYAKATKPVSQQIFEARLQLSRRLAETGDEENIAFCHELLDGLHQSIAHLSRDRFQVAMNWRYVEQFRARESWNNLSAEDVHTIEEYLSALVPPEGVNERVRAFDLMMLKLHLAELQNLAAQAKYQDNLINIAEQLSTKYTIPEVLRSKPLIEQMKEPIFYAELSQRRLDEIRQEVRELVKYLERKKMAPVYTNIIDSEVRINTGEPLVPYGHAFYKKRVERFIRENKNHLTISKLSTNKPITSAELAALEALLFDGAERGTKADFEKEYGEQPLGTFIRSILGLDQAAAQAAFGEFLQAGHLRADQITFINQIISHLTKNGVIDKGLLFESPFTDVHDEGLFGVFDDDEVGRIIRIIDGINRNAVG